MASGNVKAAPKISRTELPKQVEAIFTKLNTIRDHLASNVLLGSGSRTSIFDSARELLAEVERCAPGQRTVAKADLHTILCFDNTDNPVSHAISAFLEWCALQRYASASGTMDAKDKLWFFAAEKTFDFWEKAWETGKVPPENWLPLLSFQSGMTVRELLIRALEKAESSSEEEDEETKGEKDDGSEHDEAGEDGGRKKSKKKNKRNKRNGKKKKH